MGAAFVSAFKGSVLMMGQSIAAGLRACQALIWGTFILPEGACFALPANVCGVRNVTQTYDRCIREGEMPQAPKSLWLPPKTH